ncbi:MAG: HD domain-containing phosphohydrolase, partial [Candidatus Hydrogenedentota bacterium]
SSDYEIYSHSINVCVMGLALAQRMGYSAELLVKFGHGAMFRDIGLMNIDDRIVNNPGRLTLSEYEKMLQHPILSEEILVEIGISSDTSLEIVRHHHEKLDGTGLSRQTQGRRNWNARASLQRYRYFRRAYNKPFSQKSHQHI